jgi:hypothetical protein
MGITRSPEHHVLFAGGDVLEGGLKSSKMKLVQAWLEIHRDELASACAPSKSRGCW